MDDVGLLEWAKHEVARTKKMLKLAEDYAEELRQKVEGEAVLSGRVGLIEILIGRREFLVGCAWDENGARIDQDE
jgi:hypothetical protein